MPKNTGELEQIADRYATFAAVEARGSSETYERLAQAIAGSSEVLEFLASLPEEKRQPNLFLGAIRHLFGLPESAARLIDIVRREPARIRALMLSRTTQTNEPARCAVLLPLLGRLPQPLALVEVGASAGLCLLPDRYAYDYGAAKLTPPPMDAGATPMFECRAGGATPVPSVLPKVAWRAGLDLHPIDVNAGTETAWLETLVWPGQEKRLARLRAAIRIAQAEPPRVVKGNLLTDLAPLIAEAPEDVTLVVFHTAVLGYMAKADREQFAQDMRRSRAVWISNEVPDVFPEIARAAPPPARLGLFLLTIDGDAVAWTAPHGESIDWFGGQINQASAAPA